MSLVNGYIQGVARIFNESGEEVLERVTSFVYVHSEKVDDSSRFTIETPDISIVDNPNLQEGKILKVVFGIAGGRFRAHKVYIWDISPTFSEQGVRLEIIGYCKAAYLKLNSSKDIFDDASLEGIAEQMAEAYGLSLQKENLEGEIKPDFDALTVGGKKQAILDFSKDGVKVTAQVDNVSLVKNYAFKKYETLPQANKSDAKLLKDTAKLEPIDNFVLEGRDDNLIIKRRNLYQKPYKSYVYKGEPGYLLEFTPAVRQTKKRKKAVTNTVNWWDEEEQEYGQGSVNSTHSQSGVLGDNIELTYEDQLLNKVGEQLKNPFDQSKTVDGLFYEEFDKEDANGNKYYKRIATTKLDSTHQNFIHITKKGTKPSLLDFNKAQISAAIDAVGRIETKQFMPLNPKEHLPSVETNPTDAAGAGANRQAEQSMEINECNAKFQGDPDLQSGKIITILNVGKKYSGNYYIVSVEHDTNTSQGYICRCTLFKNGTNKVGDDPSKVDAKDLGLGKNKQTGFPDDGTKQLAEVPIKSD